MKRIKSNSSNKNGFIALCISLAITLMSCGEKKTKQDAEISKPQEMEQSKEEIVDIANASFTDGMTGKVFHSYQQIRMALVNSDADEVQKAAGKLTESLSEEQEEIKSMALAMTNTDDLDEQRELFSEFTANVESIFRADLSEGTIYKQFCPMAFEGKGGYWISNVDEIRNPYFGEKMLKCGKITETIAK